MADVADGWQTWGWPNMHGIRSPEVDFVALQQLSERTWTLGLPLGPRRKVMAALAAHDEPMASAAPPPSRGGAERRQLRSSSSTSSDRPSFPPASIRRNSRDPPRLPEHRRRRDRARRRPVAKLMGDGVLAYFGWPKAHEDEAERAVQAGLALVAAVGRLRIRRNATGLPVGIRDRPGRRRRPDRRRLGTGSGGGVETPNLAARLQVAAGAGEVMIAADPSAARSGVVLEEKGELALKGPAQPQPLSACSTSGRREPLPARADPSSCR